MNFSVGMIAWYSFFTAYLYVNADSVAKLSFFMSVPYINVI